MTEVRIAGRLSDEESRSIYVEMARVAERDLTGDALVARLAEIRATAEANGWELPPEDGRTDAQVIFDNRVRDRVEVYGTSIGQPWQPAGIGGYPAVVTPGDLALYRGAPADDATPDPEALTTVESWLRTAAAPEQAKELLTLAKGNNLVLRSLQNYATIASRFEQDRPRGWRKAVPE